ncbi:MAG: EAL domain-containing protein [Microthrixaceae bacterium]
MRALGTDQFVVNYQPIVNLGDGILGAEALVCWDHPESVEVVSQRPAYFIPIAEDAGRSNVASTHRCVDRRVRGPGGMAVRHRSRSRSDRLGEPPR